MAFRAAASGALRRTFSATRARSPSLAASASKRLVDKMWRLIPAGFPHLMGIRLISVGRSREAPVRDPHVQAMHYKISSGGGVSYLNPEPMSFSNHLGTFDLSDGKLRIVPSEHFPDEHSSRRAIQPFLEEWGIEVHLTSNIEMLRFEFDRVELIDRAPPPPPGVNLGAASMAQARGVNLGAASIAMAGSSTSLQLTCSKYPQPPKTFRATTEVQLAYRRWLGYRSRNEPLQSMAYFVLTLLYSMAGGGKGAQNRRAARLFQIDENVLRKIGELSSTKGNESTARKAAGPGKQFQALSGAEKQWLEQAIPLVIRRLGEHAYGGPLALISLRDLPSP